MKQIILTFALVLTGLALFGQSPRIRLNQITKDSITGSVVLSGSDSNMVYSRDFYIGTDTSLVFYGTTIIAGGGGGGTFVTLPQLEDSLTGYVNTQTLSDSLLNYINSITLSDSLINYISKTAAFGGDVTGTYDNIAVTNDSHNHTITTLTGIQDSLNTKAALVHNHTITDIVGLQDSLNSKAALIHSHTISDVANLQDSLNNKAALVHSHTISDVAALQDSLNDKANDADLNNYLLTSNYIVDSTRINSTGDTAYYYQNGVLIGTGAIAGGGGGGGGGTVTSVSAGTQISGMSMTITNPTTTPSIATAITSQSDFRTVIGAGTGNGTVTGITAGTFLSGGTITNSGTIALDTASAGLKTYIGENIGTVDLASQVTGTLPVANGGTGATTLTSGSFLRGNGTSAVSGSSNLSETADTVFVAKYLNVDTSTLYVDGINNRVGIGTTSPNVNFHVKGSGNVLGELEHTVNTGYAIQAIKNDVGAAFQQGVLGSNNSQTFFGRTGTNIAFMYTTSYVSTHPSVFVLGTFDNQDFVLGTNNTARITIKNDGNVGIGTTSPATKLHVDGTIRYTNRPAAGTITAIGFDTNGDLKASSSSQRYKYNIRPYNKGLDIVNQLNPVYFSYNGESRDNVGFIAEDFDNLGLSELTLYQNETIPEGIIYSNITALLTKAIQEQQAIIETQKQEIDTLKTQYETLLQRIIALENK